MERNHGDGDEQLLLYKFYRVYLVALVELRIKLGPLELMFWRRSQGAYRREIDVQFRINFVRKVFRQRL
jgi:hypothetical protein